MAEMGNLYIIFPHQNLAWRTRYYTPTVSSRGNNIIKEVENLKQKRNLRALFRFSFFLSLLPFLYLLDLDGDEDAWFWPLKETNFVWGLQSFSYERVLPWRHYHIYMYGGEEPIWKRETTTVCDGSFFFREWRMRSLIYHLIWWSGR